MRARLPERARPPAPDWLISESGDLLSPADVDPTHLRSAGWMWTPRTGLFAELEITSDEPQNTLLSSLGLPAAGDDIPDTSWPGMLRFTRSVQHRGQVLRIDMTVRRSRALVLAALSRAARGAGPDRHTLLHPDDLGPVELALWAQIGEEMYRPRHSKDLLEMQELAIAQIPRVQALLLAVQA